VKTLFNIQAAQKSVEATFFPDPLHKDRFIWGQTSAVTDGIWTKYRLVSGPLDRLYDRIVAAALEYSYFRKKFDYIDVIRLFEQAPQVRASSLEYFDLSGRIETISRESVLVQSDDGNRVALDRDMGFGFRGIIVRTEEPWAADQYALRELARLRVRSLNLGEPMQDMPVDWPWRLREAAEQQLRDLVRLAWAEYTDEPTPERLQAVMQVEKILYDYLLDTLGWLQLLGHWEFMDRIPFPDRAGAIRLWETDKLIDNTLRHDEVEPWWGELAAERETSVTAMRGAFLTTGKVVIHINTNPVLHTLEHGQLDVAHHLITYDPLSEIGIAFQNTDSEDRRRNPVLGKKGQPPWDGRLPQRDAWRAVHAEEGLPEPQLRVRSRTVRAPVRTLESLEAATAADRPVLAFTDLNRSPTPVLVLPRMYWDVMILPLYGGGRRLQPIQDTCKVEGWATDGTGRGPDGKPTATTRIFADPPFGFLQVPTAGRTSREGQITEILPYA
jgi:hypothetical protein